MAVAPNEFHLVTYDPGGTTGWTHFILDCRAFSRPEHKVLRWLKSWNCGEFTGTEEEQLDQAVALMKTACYGPMPFTPRVDIVGEDFELKQTVGGENLLSPVRINAVLAWEARKLGKKYYKQKRSLRTQITPARLKLFGFPGPWRTSGRGKDKFAAMQHAIVRLRSLKADSRSHPWKMSDATSTNSWWDCACDDGFRCDLRHPK